MRSAFIGLLLGAAAVLGTPAHATWYEASSDHFIIDADSSETRIRDFARKLERFDAELRALYGVQDDPSRRSNRIRLFATDTGTILRMCNPGCPSGTRGFYHPLAGGSVIFTSTLTASGGDSVYDLDAQEVLLHEYSHHFMFSNFTGAYPMWFTEGFAEFNANVRFNPDGSVLMGRPANYRAYGLFSHNTLSIRELLDPPARDLKDGMALDMIYGRGWLLVHYLMTNKERRGQLDTYLAEMNRGKSSIDAATTAFGDLRKLDGALSAYLAANRFTELRMPPPDKEPAVDVKPLSQGAGAMMQVHMRSTNGVNEQQAKTLLPEAEKRAAPYPNDPRVQIELAEAEYDAGNDEAADAAADRALAADPKERTAMLYKGMVAVRRATKSHSTDAKVWSAARGWYARANRADPEAALPLLLYYESYMAQDVRAPDLAVQGLQKAESLAPEDPRVHFLLAGRMLADGDSATARRLLAPIAYSAHGVSGAEAARTIIDLIDGGKITEARAAMAKGKPDNDGGDSGGKGQPKS
jgi:tetratricopeptide (TPR) repeat protein